MSSYWERLLHFYRVTDPRTLLASDSEVRAAQDLLAKHDAGDVWIDEAALETARRLRDTAVHPDTQEIVPKAFRFSGFAPMNVLICAGLLMPNPSSASILFWQIFNQSYNVAVNHANRNASNQLSAQQLGTAYAAAVSVSCGLGLSMLIHFPLPHR